MAPLTQTLQLCVLALAGMSWALPQPAPESGSLRIRQSCNITAVDSFLLAFNGCTPAEEDCHYCCTTWSSDGPNCHDDADPHPGGLCPGDKVIHCSAH